jgi:hypothetical protein
MPDFKAQLGRADHPGLASQAERFGRIVRGRNPYVAGHSRPADSPRRSLPRPVIVPPRSDGSTIPPPRSTPRRCGCGYTRASRLAIA